MANRSFNLWSGFWIPISRWICWSDRLDIMAPDLTFEAQADTYLLKKLGCIRINFTYHWGIPTHNSSQATIVAPFHCENGVPSLRTFSTSSCFFRCRLSCSLNHFYIPCFITSANLFTYAWKNCNRAVIRYQQLAVSDSFWRFEKVRLLFLCCFLIS